MRDISLGQKMTRFTFLSFLFALVLAFLLCVELFAVLYVQV